MARSRKRKSSFAVTIPGALSAQPFVDIEHECQVPDEVNISVYNYNESFVEKKERVSPAEAASRKDDPGTVTWVNIDDICNEKLIESIGAAFGVHPLNIEDIIHVQERPKADHFENYMFIILKMMIYVEEEKSVRWETISLVLGQHFLITFQPTGWDMFGPIRERIARSTDRIRKAKADYLAYVLIDAIVDNYFLILEKFGEDIDEMEAQAVSEPTPEVLQDIRRLKRNVLFLRKSVWPLREIINGIEVRRSHLFRKETFTYLRDIYDHVTQLIDTIETDRDILTSMMDIYLSTINNRMNETIKILTIISVVFIPLTFITGFFGMNFVYIPLLTSPQGYAIISGIMIGTITLMIFYFRRKNWL